MSKTAFFFFIVCILIVIGFLGWFLFLRPEVAPGTDTGTSPFSDLFPFGERPPADDTTTGGLVTTPGDQTVTPTIDIGAGSDDEIALPKLRQISTVPTAGVVAFNIGSTTVIRYIERATGHIYETTGDDLDIKKVSNTTIPKIHEALWASDGSRLIIRYIKDDTSKIRTFYARIATTTRPEQAIEGIFLSDDIREISVFGVKIFYLTDSSSGSNGVLANMDGSGRTSAFTSSFNDWRASLFSQSGAVLFPRPSGIATGAAYILNASNGSYAKIASEMPGLVALGNSDGTRVLLSGTLNRGLSVVSFDAKTGTAAGVGISTIADKCVWSSREKNIVYCAVPRLLPGGLYPDDWYKGKVSFDDGFWKIDVTSGETESVFDPELEAGVSMDMIKLSLDPAENFLLFTNKKDMTVWSYRLE